MDGSISGQNLWTALSSMEMKMMWKGVLDGWMCDGRLKRLEDEDENGKKNCKKMKMKMTMRTSMKRWWMD